MLLRSKKHVRASIARKGWDVGYKSSICMLALQVSKHVKVVTNLAYPYFLLTDTKLVKDNAQICMYSR